MSDDLAGKTALVTGAARGIGQCIAEALAARGVKLALTDILHEELFATAEQLAAGALAISADMTDEGEVDALVAQVEAEFGSPDLLVNNAGTLSTIGPVWEAPPEKWLRDVRVNLCGTFLCCRAVMKGMVKRGRGCVVNLLGGGFYAPSPYHSSYASSKAGLARLTDSLAIEAKPFGVNVFSVLPGTVLSEMTRFIMDDPGGRRWRPDFRKQFDEGRGHPAEQTAELVVRLFRGDADHLTGRCFRAWEDLDRVLTRSEEIQTQDLHALRVRWLRS